MVGAYESSGGRREEEGGGRREEEGGGGGRRGSKRKREEDKHDLETASPLLQSHLHYRMTVDLNNLVVSLWKQELAHVKKTTKYSQLLFLTTHLIWCFSKVVRILHTVADIVH